MFEFTETIPIAAPREQVWDTVADIEGWWPASNPEHDSLEPLDDRGIEVGARLRIREKIAGIPGVAEGAITEVVPGRTVTWEAPEAHYRWHGIPLTVGEGVTWTVDSSGPAASEVSAHVWATFADTVYGRLVEWTFTRLLDGISKDRHHARTELEYLKRTIESAGPPDSETGS